MAMDQPEPDSTAQGKDFLYSVLNVNRGASLSEINDRYRHLSLIFHPDKQRDESAKEIATKSFLEIQKAYQVLSDPFMREVYDTLGNDGLKLNWPAELRSKSTDELRTVLRQAKFEFLRRERDEQISPRGSLSCVVLADRLFEPYTGDPLDSWPQQLVHRLQGVKGVKFQLEHSVKKSLTPSTSVAFAPRITREGPASSFNLSGTLRHQFSPRFTTEASLSLLNPQRLELNGTYEDNGTLIAAKTVLGRRIFPPNCTIAVTRKLFRQRFEQAVLELHVGRIPHFSFLLRSPAPFHFGPRFDPPSNNIPSVSGLASGVTQRTIGLSFQTLLPKLIGEWSITFSELQTTFKMGVELSLTGLSWMFGGSWSNKTDTEFTASTHLTQAGVILNLELIYLEQRYGVPVILSSEYDAEIALWTVVIPSTLLLLSHQFIIKPRRRIHRLAKIRAAKRSLAEDSESRRERDVIANLLKDAARKSKQAEILKDGLIIVEASYGVHDTDVDAKDLLIDVTIPLQALVRNSQLYIPGDQTKSGLQGFWDVAPFAQKSLRIRYEFRDRLHYAEIPDETPVVLPLAEHAVP